MKIEFLADRPEFIPQLADWHHEEWSYFRPTFTLADRIEELKASCGRHEVPVTFVALEGARLLGSAMLVPHDMDYNPHWTPWLASVFTAPEARRQGIATRLCEHVMHFASALGLPRIYLYTPSAESFYARLGWSVLERINYKGVDVTIMSCDPVTQPGRF
jgi:GNAT superfamily N-acetyltransferase